MKTRILGDAVVIKSGITFSDMQKVAKYAPEAMALKDECGDETFKLNIGEYDSVSNLGIVFVKNNNDAIARVNLPLNLEEDRKEYVAKQYGIIIKNACTVEKQIEEALSDVDDTINEIERMIEVLD